MKIEITKRVSQIHEIDVNIPYYYKHDLYSDHGESVIYGMITETSNITIHEKLYPDYTGYSMQIETHTSIKDSELSSYFEVGHKSTDMEFENVKKRMLLFFQANFL